MRTKLHFLIAVAVGVGGATAAADTNTAAPAPLKLCVATFNLRYASNTRPNSWAERRPVMRECLRQLAPDLLGTQEGLHQQLKDIATDLPGYDWIGTGRDGGDKGEFMAVFFRRDRFTALATNHFWLSDTPEVVASSTWGNTCKRMVTCVRFRENASGREFHFWNTHFDHEVELARRKSAQLVRERIAALPSDLPLLLTGDFNSAAGKSRPHEILVKEGGLTDTWTVAKSRVNEAFNSFNSFRQPRQDGVRIDWILTRGAVDVERTEIVTFAKDGQYPSDHFPVAAWLTLP
jgi:endonuclease/exonuclease/phosphatase family metal-dependent hydrolase